MGSAPSPQAIAAVLGGTVKGDTVFLPTPGHSKRDRGTTITVDANAPDGCLVHSFNGGDPLAIKDQLRDAGVLEPRPANDHKLRAVPPARWKQTGVYEYDDGEGNAIYRTIREEAPGHGKRFRAERYEGGKWVNGLGDIDRLPYRFTELCRAAETAREAGEPEPPVYFVEGERKADKLASWGILATAIPFGANGWREEYGEAFRGSTVIILPDNDAPGFAFAEQVKATVEEYEGRAVIIELPRLGPKGDIVDWDGTPDELRNLTDKALAGGLLPMGTLDLQALASRQPRQKAFAIAGVAPLGEVTLFTGAGSAGKSLLGQQIATCAAAGVPCLGLDVLAGPSLYVTCEDDQDQLHWRQAQICSALGVPMAGLSGALHLTSLRGELDNPLCAIDNAGVLTPTPTFHRMARMARLTRAQIVILDNVAHLFTGNENDRGDVTRFVNLLNRLAGETGAAILLIGHPNKSGDDYSGSTAWLNAVRSQVFLRHDLDTDVRTLTVGKANYARKGEAVRFLWVDGAFMREDDLPPDRARELESTIRATNDNDTFLACLRERNRQERAVSESKGTNYAPLVFARMPESKGIGKSRLEDAMDRLFRIGAIERGELPWKSRERHATIGLRESAANGAAN